MAAGEQPWKDYLAAGGDRDGAGRAGVAHCQVRVPVVFDHMNDAFREEVRHQRRPLERLVGNGASVMCGEGLRFGKFEVWLEFDAPLRHATASAIRAVETALTRVGLAPTNDAKGLNVIASQVIIRG